MLFLTGTDEHGQKMQQTAEKEGIAPIELANRNSAVFRDLLARLNCSRTEWPRAWFERLIVAFRVKSGLIFSIPNMESST